MLLWWALLTKGSALWQVHENDFQPKNVFRFKYWKVSRAAFWEKAAIEKMHSFCVLKQLRFAPCTAAENTFHSNKTSHVFHEKSVSLGCLWSSVPQNPLKQTVRWRHALVQPPVLQLWWLCFSLHPRDWNWWKPCSLKHWNARISSISTAFWLPEEKPAGKLDQGLWPPHNWENEHTAFV